MLRIFGKTLGSTSFELTNVRTQQGVCNFLMLHRRTCCGSPRQEVSSSGKSDHTVKSKKTVPPPPPPLELCCMSGCQNCVLLQHAEELLKFYEDDSAARAAIDEIPDENLKAFLKIELNLK